MREPRAEQFLDHVELQRRPAHEAAVAVGLDRRPVVEVGVHERAELRFAAISAEGADHGVVSSGVVVAARGLEGEELPEVADRGDPGRQRGACVLEARGRADHVSRRGAAGPAARRRAPSHLAQARPVSPAGAAPVAPAGSPHGSRSRQSPKRSIACPRSASSSCTKASTAVRGRRPVGQPDVHVVGDAPRVAGAALELELVRDAMRTAERGPGGRRAHRGAYWRFRRYAHARHGGCVRRPDRPSAAQRPVRTRRDPHTATGRPAAGRRDPVELLGEQDVSRVPELVPIRYGRMLVSPFAFYRGAAAIMAADLAARRRRPGWVPACGDAHLSNFGRSPRPSDGSSSTSTTSTRRCPGRSSGTSSGSRRASRSPAAIAASATRAARRISRRRGARVPRRRCASSRGMRTSTSGTRASTSTRSPRWPPSGAPAEAAQAASSADVDEGARRRTACGR